MSWPSVPGTKWRRHVAACRAAVFKDSLEERTSLYPWRRAPGLVSWPPKEGFGELVMRMPGGPVRIIAHSLASEGTMLVFSDNVTMAHEVQPDSLGVADGLRAEADAGRRPSIAIVSPLTWAALNTEMAATRRYDATFTKGRLVTTTPGYSARLTNIAWD